MSPLLFAWLAEAGLMTYRIAKNGRPNQPGQKIPWPADYLATFVIYGTLSVIADVSPEWGRFANVFGWGLVAATVLNFFDPANLEIGATQTASKTSGAAVLQSAVGAPAAPSTTLSSIL